MNGVVAKTSAQGQTSSFEVGSTRGRSRRYSGASPKLPLLIRRVLARFLNVHILASLKWLLRAVSGQGRKPSDEESLNAAAGWLLEAQKVSGGGYAHSFNLLYGWQPPYPETTGYILPTLRELHCRSGNEAYRASISTAMRWLVSIQLSDGSFSDLKGQPQVFDTGQILIGFNDIAQNAPDLVDLDALRRAAHWLCSVQECDGSFIRNAYNGIPHAYYSRVGAALAVAGRLLDDAAVREAGIANLRWTVAQQQENGFFRHLSFDSSPPFLHTMVYVIEGLLDGAVESGDVSFYDAAVRFADRLRRIAETRDGVLRSQYWEDYTVANRERCLTGVAQWAGTAFRLSRETGDVGWSRLGCESLDFLKIRQILSRDRCLNGGLPGSAPIYGRYMRGAIPNWGVKFFIDAIIEKQKSEASCS